MHVGVTLSAQAIMYLPPQTPPALPLHTPGVSILFLQQTHAPRCLHLPLTSAQSRLLFPVSLVLFCDPALRSSAEDDDRREPSSTRVDPEPDMRSKCLSSDGSRSFKAPQLLLVRSSMDNSHNKPATVNFVTWREPAGGNFNPENGRLSEADI